MLQDYTRWLHLQKRRKSSSKQQRTHHPRLVRRLLQHSSSNSGFHPSPRRHQVTTSRKKARIPKRSNMARPNLYFRLQRSRHLEQSGLQKRSHHNYRSAYWQSSNQGHLWRCSRQPTHVSVSLHYPSSGIHRRENCFNGYCSHEISI